MPQFSLMLYLRIFCKPLVHAATQEQDSWDALAALNLPVLSVGASQEDGLVNE